MIQTSIPDGQIITMNSEPIIKEVEETFYLSIPQPRVDVVNKIISKNPDISNDLARDLVLSASMGIRVPSPLYHEPEGALDNASGLLEEFWYNIKTVTAKTLTFAPVDIILNQDKKSISLHIRWTYKDNVSESTMFINFKKFNTLREFTNDLFDKLNKSLNTNLIPYRLVFLSYGKMARLACVPLSGARKLAEENKVVFDNLSQNVRDIVEEPDTNCSLVPTLKELLDELPNISKSGDFASEISKDEIKKLISDINEVVAIHPEELKVEVDIDPNSFMRKRPDALPDGPKETELDTIEVTLKTEDTHFFVLDENYYFHLPNYLNAALAKASSSQKFYAVQSDYQCETVAITCCTEEQIKQFKKFGYVFDKPERWSRNKKAIES